MKRKPVLFLTLVALLFSGSLLAAIPESLSMQGTALAESQEAVGMKLTGTVFELYTSLQTGEYSFAGDNSIAAASLTVDGTAPYRIRVDYSAENPVVTLQKIVRVYMWAPWNQYTIADLSYNGASTFKATNLKGIDGWGDDRYRIRVIFEGEVMETYGEKATSSPDLALTNNGQWGAQGDLPERNFKLAARYKNTGVSFDVEVSFKSDADYTHTISDYVASTVPASLSMQGNALAETATALQMKRNGSVYELFTSLQSGSYSFSESSVDAGTITVEGSTAPYLIRVNFSGETPVVVLKKIKKVAMWVPWTQHDVVQLNYSGNSSFSATNILCSKANWGFSEAQGFDDTRYRFRITFDDDVFETYGPRTEGGFDLIGNDQWGSGSDYNYNMDIARYKETNQAFNVTVMLPAEGNYSHIIADYVPGTGITSPKKEVKAVEIYPSVVSSELTVKTKDAGFSVEIISVTGTTVMKNRTFTNELQLSAGELSEGIYVVRVSQNGKTVSTRRVIKK